MSPMEALLACKDRATLRAVWLGLTEQERNELRPKQWLAEHAWSILKRTAE